MACPRGRIPRLRAELWTTTLALLLAGGAMARAQWPQWRGPSRDGRVPPSVAVGDWLAEPRLLWERDVGEGHSGPVVDGDRLWVHARRRAREVVSCLSVSEGALLWSGHYDADFEQDSTARAHGEGPYSTPSVADGRLFTFGVTAILSAWDATTGELLWRTDYSEESRPDFPLFGVASSPLVWEDMCFAHFGGTEGRRFGSPGRGAMVALRVTDGQERWRWTGDGPAMGASPVVARIGEQWQLVFKTQERIVGLDPHTGRELWQIAYRVAEDNTIVSPLVLGDRLVTSDYQKGTTAWRIRLAGDTWSLQELWHNPTVSLSLSSPVVVGDQLVVFSHNRKGHLCGLDPADGQVLWRGETRWGAYVHVPLISWGNELLALRGDGLLVVGEVSQDAFHPVHTYRLGRDMTWAHPAIVDGRIVIRDRARLAVYRLRVAE